MPIPPSDIAPVDIAPEVAAALGDGRAVVALESTIITHGMPYPDNVATARRVETVVREGGAVPATIAVIEGRLRIGLDNATLDALAHATGVWKLSRADLGVAVATGRTGSTTVAATMIAARRAGITTFATGGIGGVHRGAEHTFDMSADLAELARTPVIVVCAGAKAILDIPKTLEVLETQGVPVIGYQTDDWPAFWSLSSGLPAPLRLDDPDAIARAHAARSVLGLEGGMLIGNPLAEGHAIPRDRIEKWIAEALSTTERDGITGKAVTPALLSRMLDLSGGKTLDANIALIESNARLAARIARAVSSLNSAQDLNDATPG